MQTAIKVEQLSKSYGNLLAIDQISLSVKYGTVYGLLGANGAGKSTTIECILGTKKADSGTVFSDLFTAQNLLLMEPHTLFWSNPLGRFVVFPFVLEDSWGYPLWYQNTENEKF